MMNDEYAGVIIRLCVPCPVIACPAAMPLRAHYKRAYAAVIIRPGSESGMTDRVIQRKIDLPPY